jgi:hypothetical protein
MNNDKNALEEKSTETKGQSAKPEPGELDPRELQEITGGQADIYLRNPRGSND